MRGSAMLGTSVLNPGSSVPLFEVVSSIRIPFNVRHQDSLGSDHRRCRHRAHHRLGGDAMDRVAIGLPTATWSAVVRALARRSGLPAPGRRHFKTEIGHAGAHLRIGHRGDCRVI